MTEQSLAKRLLPIRYPGKAHPFWVFAQHGAIKLCLLTKFLIAARWLGPEQIGMLGIALLLLTILENLSETGLAPAVVQRVNSVADSELTSVWLIQAARGLALCLLLIVIAPSAATFFGASQAVSLIQCVALLPFLKGLISPGLAIAQRERSFRSLFLIDAGLVVIDLSLTVTFLNAGLGPLALVLSSGATEAGRLCLSWIFFPIKLPAKFGYQVVPDLHRYGRWIWASGVLVLAVNQLDKLIVAKFLGTAELGIYHTASRLTQLAIADLALAYGQYLFPNFARDNRTSSAHAKARYQNALLKLSPVLLFQVALLNAAAPFVVVPLLGDAWKPMLPLMTVMSFTMLLGGLAAVQVAYQRAVGFPKNVSEAMLVQLCVLAVAAPALAWFFGALGVAGGAFLSVAACVLWLNLKTRKGFA